jgi:hypothetical protein
MTETKKSTANTPVAVPPLADVDEDRKPGPGEVVVTSPTGTRTIVAEYAAESLKSQGYRVG